MRQISKQAAGTPTPKPIVTPFVLTLSSRSSSNGDGGGANGRVGGGMVVGGGGDGWRQPSFPLRSTWQTTGSSTDSTGTPRSDNAAAKVGPRSVATRATASASLFAWISAVTRMLAAATTSETRARSTFSSSARLSANVSLSNVLTVPLTTTATRTTVGGSTEAMSALLSSAAISMSISSSTRASEGATLPKASSLTRGSTRLATTCADAASATCREIVLEPVLASVVAFATTSNANLMSKFTAAFASSLRPAPSTMAIAGSTSSCAIASSSFPASELSMCANPFG
mmetsp:Transcript_9639/g.22932  ORF Transcript_9639/g.22932 Transcript_9639/m.22932 type:complete len:286 (-) Transcript_9639:1277-2134(-)